FDNSFPSLTLDSVLDQQGFEGSSVSLMLSSEGGSPSELVTYGAQGLPVGLSINSATGEISGVLAAGSSAMSPYTVTVTADKPSSDQVSQQFSWTVSTSNSGGGEVLYRVNTGGSTIASHDDSPVDWSSDTGNFGSVNNSIYLIANSTLKSTYDQGKSSAYDGPIVMTDPSLAVGLPSELFETERYDRGSDPNMQWSFPVNNGTLVEVRLYFAELWSGITGPGQRVFDVSVEGTVPTEFTNIDAFGRNGALGAFMLSYQVTVTDGSLDLELIRNIQDADINAIEIIE
ncbi:malectin domain-containing carbohydrate-binding protein, partial [Aureicoccus marinus]